MWITGLSSFSEEASRRKLFRRKGGGGKGRGGRTSSSSGGGTSSGGKTSGSSSSGGSSSSSSSSSSSGGRSSGSSSSRSSGSRSNGGTNRINTIPAGQPFAGRTQGGGTRASVFGTRQYGSGYPGVAGRGVAGRSFPFYYWPIAWGGAAGAGTGAYLRTNEYGNPDNNTRPGGPEYTAAFIANSSTASTFHLIADSNTVTSLISDLMASCSSYLSSVVPPQSSPLDSSAPNGPQPEQAVQYYRASSVVLTLDGYNNTAVFGDEGTADLPLPDVVVDLNTNDGKLLGCLNQTIGTAVPLIDGATAKWIPDGGALAVIAVVWSMKFALGCV
ncbi:hypothetical protein BDN71DRAFT_1415537 [Pleurotus eryngii]|uniref:Uncharacterized protein n=1 Tax=Pleurotus eryngii TaxID=5323 RepID=A0A9P6A0K9_PLEER|nr:hypothetical protein BDN71DRAFT_1415537 [Pleurotus eryngii]